LDPTTTNASFDGESTPPREPPCDLSSDPAADD
jgi:hypothetical protein